MSVTRIPTPGSDNRAGQPTFATMPGPDKHSAYPGGGTHHNDVGLIQRSNAKPLTVRRTTTDGTVTLYTK